MKSPKSGRISRSTFEHFADFTSRGDADVS
jgi:hypothetical protein